MAKRRLSPWGFIGFGGMACVLFLDLGTANIAPWWVTGLLLILWLLLFAVAARWFLPSPGRVPWLPALAFVVWVSTIVFGARQFGWGS